jgi:NAD kinase
MKELLIKIETADNDLFLSIADHLKRIEKKHPEQIEVVKVDENHRTILFISSSYLAANISRILMENDFWDEKEGEIKVERITSL